MWDFRTLNIWQDGMEMVKEIYGIIDTLPPNEKFGLSNQISRATVSIPSNIAEGCSRSSQKEFNRFLEIALGSAFELETQILILSDINLLNKDKIEGIIEQIHKLQKQINSLMKKLKANN